MTDYLDATAKRIKRNKKIDKLGNAKVRIGRNKGRRLSGQLRLARFLKS